MRAHVDGRRQMRSFRWSRIVALGCTVSVASIFMAPIRASAASSTATAGATASYYEFDASPVTLAWQGSEAARTGATGLVVLDFGRPAFDGSSDGMINFSGSFVSFGAVQLAVESYLSAYTASAPRGRRLNVAVGTNNSCGTGQPCGQIICGCLDEPSDFGVWGAHLAATVMRLRSWTASLKAASRSVEVKVVAGDDAEPSYDPGYTNTADVLGGYARAVGGFQPSMVDFGSAEPGYWTLDQVYQVAYGFKPDLPVPEVYFAADVADWVSVVAYAHTRYRVAMTIFGVLTNAQIGNTPESATGQMITAMRHLTGQKHIQWSSNIPPLFPV
jgi:hypothetical protein